MVSMGIWTYILIATSKRVNDGYSWKIL